MSIIASLITANSTVFQQRRHQTSILLLFERSPPETDIFKSQLGSNAETVSLAWQCNKTECRIRIYAYVKYTLLIMFCRSSTTFIFTLKFPIHANSNHSYTPPPPNLATSCHYFNKSINHQAKSVTRHLLCIEATEWPKQHDMFKARDAKTWQWIFFW